MKKKRGFTLKSGNNIGAKGRKPSNFKMMGASPAKALDVFKTTFDADGNETVERVGTGRGAIEAGVATEKANERKREYNSKLMESQIDKLTDAQDALFSGEQGVVGTENQAKYDELGAQIEKLTSGDFEGGKRTTKVDYTGPDARDRELLKIGKMKTRTGTYPAPQGKFRGTIDASEYTDPVESKAKEDELISKIKSQRGMPMKKKGFKMKRKK
tara:strand:+ start:595 stop:1236 length:642 start_codon:yes stop_codon:yes gene_type:complete